MKYLSLTVAAAALILTPTAANAQFFGGFDNSSVLGGLTGAGIGGAIGSNIAGSGNRDEGTAIGAALGGLAGVSYGNRNSRYGGNPYAGSFNPGFSGNSLFGTAAGAGIGGVIGSNLAGSGVRQEGTAIGAALGGLAGYGLTRNRSRYGNAGTGNSGFGNSGFGNSGFGGGYAPAGFGGGSSRYGNTGFGNAGFGAPSFGGFVPQNYGPSFQPAGFAPMPIGGTSFAPGGYVNAGTFANTTLAAPAAVYQPRFTGVTVAAPNVTLAAPSYSAPVLRRSIGSTVTQNYVGSTGISAPLILRSAPNPQVVVIKRDDYTPRVSSASTHSHSGSHGGSHGGIHADTVNINYGNNSQVGTTSSNNGASSHSHAAGGYSAPIAPVYSAPVYSAPVYSAPATTSSVNTGSYTVGSTSVLDGYESYSKVAPSAAAGGSYFVGSGQSFQVPSAQEIAADCATTTFGCAGSTAQSYDWNTQPQETSYDSSYTPSHTSNHSKASGKYSYCGSDKVYNDDGALLVRSSPVCR